MPPLLLFFMAGIYAAGRIPFSESLLIAGGFLFFILLLASTVKKWKRLSFSSACLIFLVLGILNGRNDLHPIPGPRDIGRFAGAVKMTLEGTVAENPRVFPNRAELIIETKKIIEELRTYP